MASASPPTKNTSTSRIPAAPITSASSTFQPDNTLANGRVFAVTDRGAPDGIRVDAEGRLYAAAGDGIHIFSPAGKLILKILLPETPANCAFGGSDGHTLFMTARSSLYAVELRTRSP